jgi:hypothetical protein
MAARIAMMAITTSNSINVKAPNRPGRLRPGEGLFRANPGPVSSEIMLSVTAVSMVVQSMLLWLNSH